MCQVPWVRWPLTWLGSGVLPRRRDRSRLVQGPAHGVRREQDGEWALGPEARQASATPAPRTTAPGRPFPTAPPIGLAHLVEVTPPARDPGAGLEPNRFVHVTDVNR